jgi:hypothetical protein
MLRTFSEIELAEMCKTRPEGYRADVLAIAVKRSDGVYEVDTSSAAFQALRHKYVPRPPELPRFNPADRARVEYEARVRASGTADSNQRKVMTFEEVLASTDNLLRLFGPASVFAEAVAEYRRADKAGMCRSCGRNRQLRRLFEGFKKNLMQSDTETRKLARAMFPDALYVELLPVQIKWSDIIKEELDAKPPT